MLGFVQNGIFFVEIFVKVDTFVFKKAGLGLILWLMGLLDNSAHDNFGHSVGRLSGRRILEKKELYAISIC